MPDDTREIMPAGQAGQFGNLGPQLGGPGLPPSLQILLNDGLYDRVKQLAGVMARSEGFTPKHLLGKAEACFTVITIALDAKLNPNFVARHTYQTPAGSIGYDGALVQSILEQSGRFIGPPQFQYVGDWSKVTGRFEKATSQRGGEYLKPSWTAADAKGLGVIVRWQVKGEDRPRVWPGDDDPFLLTQCYPLNSPLWATDPKTQISYLAIRRFANIAAPGILGAAAFAEEELIDASEHALDITPEPRRQDFKPPEHLRETGRYYDVTDLEGEVHTFSDPDKAASALRVVLSDAEVLDEAWGLNEGVIGSFDERLRSELSREYVDLRERVLQTAERAAEAARRQETPERGTAVEPERNPDDAAVDSGEAATTTSGGSEGEAETRRTAAAEPQQGGPVPEPTGKPAEPHREPGGIPGPAEQPSQAGIRSVAAPVERPESGGGDPSPQPSPARDDDRGERRAENRVGAQEPEPARTTTTIPIPLKGGTGKPDLRTWAVALFLPKVRRQTRGNDLAWLMGDNAEAVEACRNGGLGVDDLREFTKTVDEAWKRCK